MAGSFSLAQLTPPLQTIGLARGAAPAIFSLIDRKPSIDAASDEGAKPKSVVGDIEVSGVKFVYPSRCVLFSLLPVFRSSLTSSTIDQHQRSRASQLQCCFPGWQDDGTRRR
jgi:hypothetical protein